MSLLRRGWLGIVLLLLSLPAQSIITGELIMLRSEQPFTNSLELLKSSIKKQGYVLSRIQRVDSGLTMSGFKTDDYRVVFFGKTEQIDSLTANYPELIPYLPLKIVIYAEAGETLLVTSDPEVFIDLYPDPSLRKIFKQWHDDIISIMKNVQEAK